MTKLSAIKGQHTPDTHLAGQLIGFLGPLISRCDHGGKAPLASLLLIVFRIRLWGRGNGSIQISKTPHGNK